MNASDDNTFPIHLHPDIQQIRSMVHGQPLTDLNSLLNEQSFALNAASFLKEVQLSEEFWVTRRNPVEDQINLGLALSSVLDHFHKITSQIQKFGMRIRR